MNTEQVLDGCMYYDLVVNYAIGCNDYLSKFLIDDYRNYILYSDNDVDLKKEYDYYMYLYVSDREFYYFVQKKYNEIDVFIDEYRLYLLYCYDEYLDYSFRNIKFSKWL